MEKIEVLEIEGLIFQISRLMKQKMVVVADFSQLSILQIQTLMFLKDSYEEANMSDLADFLHIELPSVTSLIDKLVNQNLVERLSDKKDRRIVRIKLTQKGKKLLVKTIQTRNKRAKELLSYLSGAQKQELILILRTIKNHLEEN